MFVCCGILGGVLFVGGEKLGTDGEEPGSDFTKAERRVEVEEEDRSTLIIRTRMNRTSDHSL